MSSLSCDVDDDDEVEVLEGNKKADSDEDSSSGNTFNTEQREKLDVIPDSPTDARLARERMERQNEARHDDQGDEDNDE
jgi:hypothetical protein